MSLNLSVTAVRALILALNLGLILGVGAFTYDTFFADRKEEYRVPTPKLRDFVPPAVAREGVPQEEYLTIARTFERAKEAPPPIPSGPAVPTLPEPIGPNLSSLTIQAMIWDDRPDGRSVFITMPGVNEPISFRTGSELSERTEFGDRFKGVKVKEITATAVVFVDTKTQKETTLQMKAKP